MTPLISSAEDCHLHQHRLSWIGLALGLGLHTILDGVALAASVMAGSHAENSGNPPGNWSLCRHRAS